MFVYLRNYVYTQHSRYVIIWLWGDIVEKKKYINKPVNFRRDDPEEMALKERLDRELKHGEFSEITKQMWKERLMKKEE